MFTGDIFITRPCRNVLARIAIRASRSDPLYLWILDAQEPVNLAPVEIILETLSQWYVFYL